MIILATMLLMCTQKLKKEKHSMKVRLKGFEAVAKMKSVGVALLSHM